MTSDIARLEREIASERTELLANLALLEDRARALTDWRRQVRKRPLAAVGAAAAGGLLLAMITDRRSQSAASESTDSADDPRTMSRSHPIIDRIISALAVVAAERAFAALGISMPSTDDAPADEREPRTPRADREPRAARGDRGPRAARGDRKPRAAGGDGR